MRWRTAHNRRRAWLAKQPVCCPIQPLPIPASATAMFDLIEQSKRAIADAFNLGCGMMQDGKHVPVDEWRDIYQNGKRRRD